MSVVQRHRGLGREQGEQFEILGARRHRGLDDEGPGGTAIDEKGYGGHRRALAVAERYGLPATAGVHPHEARIADEAAYDELRGLAREGRIVAIGKIGLDFHYDHSPRDAQRQAFRRQIRLARDLGLPIVVHTREADGETADMLEQRRTGCVCRRKL